MGKSRAQRGWGPLQIIFIPRRKVRLGWQGWSLNWPWNSRATISSTMRGFRIGINEAVAEKLGRLFLKPNYLLWFFGSGLIPRLGFPSGSDGKESACNAGDSCLIPGLGRSPGERKWLPTLVFLPGESRGQRSLAGYSPWGCKELDMTEWLTHIHTRTHACTH